MIEVGTYRGSPVYVPDESILTQLCRVMMEPPLSPPTRQVFRGRSMTSSHASQTMKGADACDSAGGYTLPPSYEHRECACAQSDWALKTKEILRKYDWSRYEEGEGPAVLMSVTGEATSGPPFSDAYYRAFYELFFFIDR